MNQHEKRFISLLLAACIGISSAQLPVLAVNQPEQSITVQEEQSGEKVLSVQSQEEGLSVQAEGDSITQKGSNIWLNGYTGTTTLNVASSGTIYLKGTNRITVTSGDAIHAKGSLTIVCEDASVPATLELVNNGTDGESGGIFIPYNCTLTVKDGANVTSTAKNGNYPIYADPYIKFTAGQGHKEFSAPASVVVENGGLLALVNEKSGGSVVNQYTGGSFSNVPQAKLSFGTSEGDILLLNNDNSRSLKEFIPYTNTGKNMDKLGESAVVIAGFRRQSDFTYDGTAHLPTINNALKGKLTYTCTPTGGSQKTGVKEVLNAGVYSKILYGGTELTGRSVTVSQKPVVVNGITANDKTFDGNDTAKLNLSVGENGVQIQDVQKVGGGYDAGNAITKRDEGKLTVSAAGHFVANTNSRNKAEYVAYSGGNFRTGTVVAKKVSITELSITDEWDCHNYEIVASLSDGGVTAKTQTETTATIKPKSIDPYVSHDIEAVLDASSFSWTGEDDLKAPTVTITDQTRNDTLRLDDGSEDWDYTLSGISKESHINTVETGDYKLTATGKGNYTGAVTLTWNIHKTSRSINLTAPKAVYNGAAYNKASYTINANGRKDSSETAGKVTVLYRENKAGAEYTSNAPVNAGNYTVKVTVAETEHYSAAEATADFTIEKAQPAVSFKDGYSLDKTYDSKEVVAPTAANCATTNTDANQTVTVEYKKQSESDDEYITAATVHAGDYTVRLTISETENYKSCSVTQNFVIRPAEVHLTWNTPRNSYNNSIPYEFDNQEHAPDVTVSGLYETDTVNPTVKYQDKDGLSNVKPVHAGDYTAVVTALDNSNYKLPENPTEPFSISPKALDTAYFEAVGKTYNGTIQSPSIVWHNNGTDTTLEAGTDYITYGEDSGSEPNADNAYYWISVKGKGDYTGTVKLTWSVSKLETRIVVTDAMKDAMTVTYGTELPKLVYTYQVDKTVKTQTGYDTVTEEETPAGAVVKYVGTTCDGIAYESDKAPTNAGAYQAIITVPATAYWQFCETVVDFQVKQKELSVILKVKDKTYDGTTDAELDLNGCTIEAVTLPRGDSVDKLSLSADVTFDSKDAGTRNAAVTNVKFVDKAGVTGEDSVSGNYKPVLSNSNITAEVSPVEVKVTSISVKDKVYDGTTDAEIKTNENGTAAAVLTGSIPEAEKDYLGVTADAVFASSGARESVKVSFINVVLTTSNDTNAKLSNYELTNADSVPSNAAKISQRPVQITAVDTVERAYNGSKTVIVDWSRAVLEDAVGDTGILVNDKSSIHLTSVGTAAVEDANVQYDKNGNVTTQAVTLQNPRLSGSKAGNYILGDVCGVDAKITPIEVTSLAIAVDGFESPVVYNGQERTVTAEIPDSVWKNDGSRGVVFTLNNSAAKPVDAGEYTLTELKLENGNYKLNLLSNPTITIQPKSISNAVVTLTGSLTYNGTEQTQCVESVTIDGLNVSERTISGNKNTNAGTYTLSVASDSSNFTGTATKSYTIAKRPITVTADNKTKLYGEADPAFTYTVTAGSVVEGDTLDISMSRDTGTDAGTYRITPVNDTAKNTNYDITVKNGRLTIKPQNLSGAVVTLDTSTLVYNGKTQTKTVEAVTVGGIAADIGVDVTVSNNTGKNAGDYTINLIADGKNFVGETSAQFTIEKRTATVTAEDKSKVYGKADPELTYTTSNVLTGDELNIALTRESGEDVRTYKIQVSASNDNYDVTLNDGIFTIVKKTLDNAVVTLGDSLVYNGENQRQAVAEVVADGKSIDSRYYTVTGNERKDAGIYELVVSIDNGNICGSVTKEFTVAPKPASITVKPQTKTYGERDPEWTYENGDVVTIDGILEKDLSSSNISVTRQAGEDVGDYDITVSAANANYALTLNNNTMTINPLDIADTAVTMDNTPLVYNGEEQTKSVSSVTVKTELSDQVDVTCDIYNNKETEAGSYILTIAGKGNFTGTLTRSFTIAPLTLTENNTEVELSENDLTYNGKSQAVKVKSITVTTSSGKTLTPVYELKDNEAKNAGRYTMTVEGAGTNYTGSLNFEYSIAKAKATVRANPVSVVYGSKIPALTYTTEGVCGTDSLNVRLTRDAGADVGVYNIYVSAEHSNYQITTEASKLTITPCDISKAQLTLSKSSYTFNRTARKPAVTLTLNGKTIPSSGYSAAYSNNIEVGKAVVTVTAKGNYQGKLTKSFTIVEDTNGNTDLLNRRLGAAFSGTSMTIQWGKVSNADGYEVYFGRCNGLAMKKTADIQKSGTTTYTVTGLNAKNTYKTKIKAYRMINGKKVYIATGMDIHVAGGKAKKTNAKSISVKNSSVYLSKGKSVKINTTIKKQNTTKKLVGHVSSLRYWSTNTSVAKVSTGGKITATGTGNCTVYVMAENGMKKAVSVRVG